MTVAAERLAWRFDAYARLFQACAQSGVSAQRFLTVRTERLRLRFGESARHSQVPMVFAPDLAERLGALLPAAQPQPSRGALTLERDKLRQVLGLAQLDADLDVLDVVGFQAADALANTLARFYARVFEEARASGAGEETAALFGLVAHSTLRNVLLHRMGANERFLGTAALVAFLSDRALAANAAQNATGISARLGLLLVAACSPVSVMGAASAVVGRPCNVYRTLPSVFAQARHAIRENVDRPEAVDLVALSSRLAATLLVDQARRRDLERAVLAEAVRDCALLSTLTQGSELREVAGKSAVLTETLFTPLGPQRLKEQLSRHPKAGEGALGRLRVLLDATPAVLAGDFRPLAGLGSLEQRAQLAATGALVLALDELALEQGADALGSVRPVPPHEAHAAREDGRAYWFGLDDAPLYQLPRVRDEAFFFVDMKDFTRRTARVHADAMGEFLARLFYNPILRTCGHLGRNPGARLQVVNLLGDAVAARGDIGSTVSLSLFVLRQFEEAARELAQAGKALRAGADERLAEIDLELLKADEQLAALGPGPSAQRAALEAHRRALFAGREQRLASSLGAGLEASVFIAWGAQAATIEVGGPDVGAWQVTIAEHLNAAARGTNRSTTVARARDEKRLLAERAAGLPLKDPFRVHTSGDPENLAATSEFHNTGAGLTGDALRAFKAARSATLVFHPMTVAREELQQAMPGYWFPRSSEDFVLATDASGEPALAFRRTGQSIFRGLEASGGIEVWEIIPVDTGFGQLLADVLAQRR
jgi:hypothetical protein